MDTAKAVVETVPDQRPGARAGAGAAAPRPEHRAPAGGGRDPRNLREHRGRRRRMPRWSTTREDWHRGVLGIVASRLVERFTVRCSCSSRNAEDGLAQGSGRSIAAFHLLEALESMPDLFVRFGGHEHAAGCDARPSARAGVPRALQCLRRGAARARGFPAAAAISTRCWSCARSTRAAIEDVFALAPFGHGNPRAAVRGAGRGGGGRRRRCGRRSTCKCMVRQNGRTLSLKAWNFAGRAAELAAGTRVDVAFHLRKTPTRPPAGIRAGAPCCGISGRRSSVAPSARGFGP